MLLCCGLVVTGCTSVDPAPTDSPLPTPIASTSPEVQAPAPVDVIELHAEDIRLFAGSDLVMTLPLSDAPTTVAELDKLLGPPITEVVPDDPNGAYCVLPHTSYEWSGALRIIDMESTDRLSDYEVRILARTVAAGASTITLRSAGGVAVGDDISALENSRPDMVESFDYDGVTHSVLILEPGFADKVLNSDAVFGVAAFSGNSVVQVIGSPVPIRSTQDC